MSIECEYRVESTAHVSLCKLGYYNGVPSDIHCFLCVSRGNNSIEQSDYQKDTDKEHPHLSDMLRSASRSAINFTRSGFPTVTSDVLELRLETCKGCEFWDETGFAKTGRCKKCGCSTQAKLRMATEKCPIGKW